jgi:choline-glycine betaine transporter
MNKGGIWMKDVHAIPTHYLSWLFKPLKWIDIHWPVVSWCMTVGGVIITLGLTILFLSLGIDYVKRWYEIKKLKEEK